MADILVYSEKMDAALELASKAKEFAGALGLGLSAAILGVDGTGAADAGRLGEVGADRVFTVFDPALDGLAVDVTAEALAQVAREAGATVVLVASTRRGKELAPRLAQKLGAGCVTDVNSLVLDGATLVAGRYAFGGNTVAMETVDTGVKVFAVMPKTFEMGPAVAGAGLVVSPALALQPSTVKLVERRQKDGDAVNLEDAERIVGIGRGLGKREDVDLGRQLAAALGAELACTKGLSDFGWLAEDRVVGLSGAKTKPDLYLSVGISGQIQHTVGISSSKLIAAINTDKDAPIFQLADYGVVGDLYEVVPALIEKLNSI
ncbi:MAG TPA: electron transfer flavoprotein subunit alpha/FixB family protein [Thermoleophilia bacterium]|nr:electron transfer flavoprotein subunit alpha/FixB family protein [Thermoleophilia bacterium]